MKANNFDDETLISFIKEKWVNGKCAMCESEDWCVGEDVMQLTKYEYANDGMCDCYLPVIPIHCGNCGYTVLVNALLSGAINEPE